jgi:hypothetical protein
MAMSDATIIYKRHEGHVLDGDGDSGNGNGSLVSSDDSELFTSLQLDAIAQAMALLDGKIHMDLDGHSEAIASLRERLVAVEASLSVLTSLLGTNGKTSKAVKTIESSEAVRKRKMRVS